MADPEFDSGDAARAYASEQLSQRLGVDAPSAARLAAAIPVEEVERPPQRPPGAAPALVRSWRWVIRDDDLDWVGSVFEALKASAGVGFFMSAGVPEPARWAALVAVLASSFKVARQALRKGGRLDPRPFQVLAVLREIEPVAEGTLLEALLRFDTTWTTPALQDQLADLRKMPMRDGVERALVVRLPDGRWKTVGI